MKLSFILLSTVLLVSLTSYAYSFNEVIESGEARDWRWELKGQGAGGEAYTLSADDKGKLSFMCIYTACELSLHYPGTCVPGSEYPAEMISNKMTISMNHECIWSREGQFRLRIPLTKNAPEIINSIKLDRSISITVFGSENTLVSQFSLMGATRAFQEVVDNTKPKRTYLPAASSKRFKGSKCTDDCSGHSAGYDWADENEIYDLDDCTGNSKSFQIGCSIFVEETNDYID